MLPSAARSACDARTARKLHPRRENKSGQAAPAVQICFGRAEKYVFTKEPLREAVRSSH